MEASPLNHGSLTSVFVLVGLATVAPPTYPSHGDEDTDRSVDVGTTGCYIPPKYAHVCLRRSHTSYSMNSQPVQRLWKLTACRQAVGTCTFSAVGATGCYVPSKYAHVRLRGSHASYSMNSQRVQRPWKLTVCRQAVGTCTFLAVVVHGPLHVRIRIFTGRVIHTAVYGGVDILLCIYTLDV